MEHLSLLQKHFGFGGFRSGQEEAVRHILRGENTLVIMPTGAGKSLIYQYAAIALRERSQEGVQSTQDANGMRRRAKCGAVSLVISPLVALMKDQVDSLQKYGIAATYINSTLSAAEQQQRSQAMREGQYVLVYVAPERLRQNFFVDALRDVVLQLLVIDEAHCISSWGHDFRPDYRRIADARRDLGCPLTVALTATATTLVQDDIVELLGMAEARRVVTGFNRPNLSFEVLYASGASVKLQELAAILQDLAPNLAKDSSPDATATNTLFGGACIIYTATRKEAEEVAAFIAQHLSNLPCGHYHAGMGAVQRERIQNAFCNGTLPIVVATNAFGMGIDRRDVRLVVHYNLPGSLEAYYQEAGRAGRDGQPARAVLLYSPQDRALQEFFIRQSDIAPQQLYQFFCLLQMQGQAQPPDNQTYVLNIKDLGRSLAWDEQKFRLALSHLEKAGIVQNVSLTEQKILRLVLADWDESKAGARARQTQEYTQHRKKQLEQVSYYAQADSCRRKILLAYFSDHSPTVNLTARYCCDYCLREQVRARNKDAGQANSLEQLGRMQRAALIILDSLRQLNQANISVGRQRIAQMLGGSSSQKMTPMFRAQRYYGRLQAIAQKQLEESIDEFLQRGYLQYRSLANCLGCVLELTQQGSEALQLREAISLKALQDAPPPKLATGFTSQIKNTLAIVKKAGASSTIEATLNFLQQGRSPAEVAQLRNLSCSTIGSHIASLIEQSRLNLDDYVTPAVRQIVENGLRQLQQSGSRFDRLREIKDILPPEISYDEIKFVLGAWKYAEKRST